MAKLVVVCGECGVNLDFEVPEVTAATGSDELARSLRTRFGSDCSLVCPRCQSLVFLKFATTSLTEPARFQRAETARTVARRDKGVRFAVGSPDAARSGVWRVWMNNRRDDVYLSARGLGGDIKASLHPNYWYFGFTREHVERDSSFVARKEDRVVSDWDRPPEFAPGWTRAFVIKIPGSEVTTASEPYVESPVVWYPPIGADEVAVFTVLLSRPGAVRGRRGFPSAEGYAESTELVTRLNLTSGEMVWVLNHTEPTTKDLADAIVQVRTTAERREWRAILRRRLEADPTFHPRAMVFGHASEGVRIFLDVSLAYLVREGKERKRKDGTADA